MSVSSFEGSYLGGTPQVFDSADIRSKESSHVYQCNNHQTSVGSCDKVVRQPSPNSHVVCEASVLFVGSALQSLFLPEVFPDL